MLLSHGDAQEERTLEKGSSSINMSHHHSHKHRAP